MTTPGIQWSGPVWNNGQWMMIGTVNGNVVQMYPTNPPPGMGPGSPTEQIGALPTLANGQPATTATAISQDALARLTQILNQYGLGSLTQWALEKLRQGASEAQILIELYDQPAFKQRFPAIDARKNNGLTPVSPSEILEYEQRVNQLLRMSGLGQMFGGSLNAQDLLAKDVSIAELSYRIEQGYMKVQSAPQVVRDAFKLYFGVNGDSAMAALFLDPNIAAPELQKMAMTAYAGGVGMQYGVGLGESKARQIADLGLSEGQIWQGFRSLDAISPLFSETLGEQVDMTKEKEGVDSVFGLAPGAQDALERRRMSRVNQMRGGGGPAMTQDGVVGLGVAQS